VNDTATCTVTDPDLFFPPTYGPTHRSTIRAAKALCGRCPVQSECLEHALAAPEEYGIWGGTTPWERSLVAARRRHHRLS
jgi:WhiB family transcriptional regulator, redox-sensing transcriptional regulator